MRLKLKFQGRSSTILYKPSIKINLSTSPSLVSTLDVFFFQPAKFSKSKQDILSSYFYIKLTPRSWLFKYGSCAINQASATEASLANW